MESIQIDQESTRAIFDSTHSLSRSTWGLISENMLFVFPKRVYLGLVPPNVSMLELTLQGLKSTLDLLHLIFYGVASLIFASLDFQDGNQEIP